MALTEKILYKRKLLLKLLLLIFPLSLVSVFFITIKTHILWEDGPDIYLYGFPFSWITQQTWVNSLERQFYILPLLIDLIVFLLLFICTFYLARLYKITLTKYFIPIILATWTICLVSIWPFLKEAYICGWWPHWTIDNYSVIGRQIYWGIH